MMNKVALVLEGGALRSFYTMGVLDAFLKHNITFDYICGVSGGALCAVNYLANQPKRTVTLNLKYLNDSRYRGIKSYWQNHTYFNLPFLFSDEVTSFYPFDQQSYDNNPTKFEVVVTNVSTGVAKYVGKDVPNHFDYVIASATVPFVSRIKIINNHGYLDGGISDSIPFFYVKEQGYQKIVTVLTRDKSYQKTALNPIKKQIIGRFYHRYPKVVESLKQRSEQYNRVKATIENSVDTFVIQPEEPVTVSRFEHDGKALESLYLQGYRQTLAQIPALKDYLGQK